jgi:hypothetical protein
MSKIVLNMSMIDTHTNTTIDLSSLMSATTNMIIGHTSMWLG